MTKLPNPVELSVSVRPDWPTFASELRRMADAIETQAEAARECADASAGGASATERHSSYDFTPCPTDPGRYSIDPRTVPAEPEDPRIAVVAKAMSDALDDNGVTTCDWTAEARFILAKLDGLVRADRAEAERDALAADADKWQRSALTLQGDRDALTDERDSLSRQVEALRAERDARSAERDALADELSDLREYVATIDQRRDELAGERDALAAKVERVRALHFGEYVEDEDRNRCFECGDDWPCPTIRALDGGPVMADHAPLVLAAAQAHVQQLRRGCRWDTADGPRPQAAADWWAIEGETGQRAALAWVEPIVAAVLDAGGAL